MPLNNITIVADRDFDAEHPAGALLNDLFTLEYWAKYSYFKQNSKGEGPSDSLAVLSDFKGASLFNNPVIRFLKKPLKGSGKYVFTVTFDFGKDPLTGGEAAIEPKNIEIEF